MKRSYLLYAVLMAAFLLLAGCGEGTYGGVVKIDGDKSACEGGIMTPQGVCIISCTDGKLPNSDGTACIDPEVATDPTPKPSPVPSPAPKSPEPKTLKIKSDAKTGCVYKGFDCGGKLTVSGGSGNYSWMLKDGSLPHGLELKASDPNGKDSKVAVIGGQPDQLIGPSKALVAKIGVEDAKDSSLSAEVELSFTVSDKINITMKRAGGGRWTDIAPAGGEDGAILFGDVSVEFSGLLRIEAAGNGGKYTWSIDASHLKCYKDGDKKNPDECGGRNDGLLSIEVDQADQTGKTAYLKIMKEELRGYRFEGVAVAVNDDYENKMAMTFASLIFKTDPCLVPVTVERIMDKTVVDEATTIPLVFDLEGGIARNAMTINVKGGTGYYWVMPDFQAISDNPRQFLDWDINRVSLLNNPNTGDAPVSQSYKLDVSFQPDEQSTLRDYIVGAEASFKFSVYTACAQYGQSPAKEFTVKAKTIADQEKIDKVSSVAVMTTYGKNVCHSGNGYMTSSMKNGDGTILASRKDTTREDICDWWGGVASSGGVQGRTALDDTEKVSLSDSNVDPSIKEVSRFQVEIYNENIAWALDFDIRSHIWFTQHWLAYWWDANDIFGENVLDTKSGKTWDLTDGLFGYGQSSWTAWHFITPFLKKNGLNDGNPAERDDILGPDFWERSFCDFDPTSKDFGSCP